MESRLFSGASFTRYDALFCKLRLNEIQRLLKKLDQDSLLIILGGDGARNVGTQKFINWFLNGDTGHELNEVNKDMLLDDLILNIGQDFVSIFGTPLAHEQISRLSRFWPQRREFILTEEEAEDGEQYEIIKTIQFVKMTDNCKKISLPLPADTDIMSLEKWPILQPYGLDYFNRGFFTAFHKVTLIGEQLEGLYRNYDCYAFYRMIEGNLTQSVGHFMAAMKVFEKKSVNQRENLTEKGLSANLRSFYEYALEGKNEGPRSDSLPKPRVLIGENTAAAVNVDPVEERSFATSSPNSPIFTIEGVEPATSVRYARTYFTTNFCDNYLLGMDFEVVTKIRGKEQPQEVKVTTRSKVPQGALYLLHAYSALLSAYSETMQLLQKEGIQSLLTVSKSITKHVQGFMSALKVFPKISDKQIKVAAMPYDASGQPVAFDKKNLNSRNMFMLRLEISQLADPEMKGKCLGSVIYANSFVLEGTNVANLTRRVPDFRAAVSDAGQLRANGLGLEDLAHYRCKSMGDYIAGPFENCRGILPFSIANFDLPSQLLQGSFTLFNGGVSFDDIRLGSIYLDFDYMESVNAFQDSDYLDILFKLRSPENFPFNTVQANSIVFRLSKECLRETFALLRESLNKKSVPFTYLDDKPEVLSLLDVASSLESQATDEGIYKDYYELLQLKTLEHALMDPKMCPPSLNVDSMMTFKSSREVLEPYKGQRVPVILVKSSVGTPSRKFARTIMRITKSRYDWILIELTPKEQATLTLADVGKKLIKSLTGRKLQDNTRVLFNVPAFITNQQAITLIERDPKVLQLFSIQTIISVISATGFFENNNKTTTMGLVSQILSGYSQSVVVQIEGASKPEIDFACNEIERVVKTAKVNQMKGDQISEVAVKRLLEGDNFYQKVQIYNRICFSALEVAKSSAPRYETLFVPFKLKVGQKLFKKNIEQMLARPKYFDDPDNIDIEKDTERLATDKNPRVVGVKGVVKLTENSTNYTLEACQGLLDLTPADAESQFEIDDYGLLLVGWNLDSVNIEQTLFDCAEVSIEKRGVRQIADLSKKEIAEIQKEYAREFLPDGVFYDGASFIFPDGKKTFKHPNLDLVVDEYIEKYNTDVGEHNRKVQKNFRNAEKAFLE